MSSEQLQKISIDEWDKRYTEIKGQIEEPPFGGLLSRHIRAGDYRLNSLTMDPSPEALNLWNFLLTEEDRLNSARAEGKTIIGTMKDLGTVPVLAYSCDNTIAFYPDGAWWIPCIMELSAGLFDIADAMGIDESFCPVRAMLGAFANENHFPRPDALICSTGAICDDFSAIAQRLQGMGFPIHWWEVPRRGSRSEEREEQLPLVLDELHSVKEIIEAKTGQEITDVRLSTAIRQANRIRLTLEQLRETVFTAPVTPIPALEMLICEMLIIHYCSDADWAEKILDQLLQLARKRREENCGFFGKEAVKVFWVNPVADLKAMNMLEESGGRICGTEYLFSHALDQLNESVSPMTALAKAALSDPMVGPTEERAERIIRDIKKFGSEALIVSKIPGASHCTIEGTIIAERVAQECNIPTLQIEIPPLCDSMGPSIRTRIEALIESVRSESLFEEK